MRIVFLFMLSLGLFACAPQGKSDEDSVEMPEATTKLSEYEGLYEYENGSTLIMVAGPNDKILYASINGARYPLRPKKKDIFLNNGDVEIVFARGDNNALIGYRENNSADLEDNPLYRLLDKSQRLPQSIWHAKPIDAPKTYVYKAPKRANDDIQVEALATNNPLRKNLEALTTEIYAENFPGVQSVLVYQNNALVFEEYFYDFGADKKHQQRSATKTLMALLMGAAIDSGHIASVNEKVLPYFSAYNGIKNTDDHKYALTIADLLSMQSGFDCNDWDGESQGNENNMIYTDDWARFIIDLPMINKPGTKGYYCSGNVILIGKIIEKATGKPLKEFADEVLFQPIGIMNYEWDFRPDLSNTNNFVQAWLRPRDMMKIGILLSDEGVWNEKQIISKNWISELTAQHSEISNTPYGYFFWRRYLMKDGQKYEIPQASGNGGQKIIVLKEYGAVVVLTGGNYNKQSHTKDLLSKYILVGLEH